MRYKIVSALCCVICCFAALSARAEVPGAKELADRLQATYDSIGNFRAEFTETQIHKASGDSDDADGVMHFCKPFLLRWEILSSPKLLIVLSEDVAWQYAEEEHIAYKYRPDFTADMGILFRILTGQSRLDEEFRINSITEQDAMWLVKARPVEPLPQMLSAEIWIDPATGYIQRVKSIDFSYNEMLVTLHGLETDTEMPDGLFSFIPPEGTKIEDNTGL